MSHIAIGYYLKLQNITEPFYGILIDREFDEFRTIYVFEMDYGPNIRVVGGIDFQRKMDDAEVDDYVRIAFLGWETLSNGRSMMIADVQINKPHWKQASQL